MRHGMLLALVITVTAGLPAAAVTIHVDWSGGADYLTIQEGINAASAGDTVRVASGTYPGAGNTNLDFGGVSAVLIGETTPDPTIIDGANSAQGFRFHSGEDTTAIVRGFVIQNTLADSGGGAFCVDGAAPKFIDCTFSANRAREAGGAIACAAASPVIVGCRFDGNAVSGGVFPQGGALALLSGSHARVEDCAFSGNTSSNLGGAIVCADSSPDFYSCDIAGNTSVFGGGGASLSSSPASFQNCTFSANHAGPWGGGIDAQSSSPFLKNCTFTGNTATNRGGGARFIYSSAPTLWRCVFEENVAAKGAAVECAQWANATIQNCTFVRNTASRGGAGVYCNVASPSITMSIIAFSQSGSALLCENSAYAANPIITYCDVYGNAGGNELCGTFSDNVSYDPRFCDMLNGDVTLCANSPCMLGQEHNPGRLIGANGPGCGDCASAVENKSWGGIKALYR
jgi:predicted outer membrane repeat protein